MTSNEPTETVSARRAGRGSYMPVIIGVFALFAGYLIGAQAGAQNAAYADKVARMLNEKELVPVSVQPPAVAVPKDGFAVVGAADDRYYLIREDGTTIDVQPDRRAFLLWRYED